MPKINLLTLPELKGMLIITSQEELKSFLEKLRQDSYSSAKIKKLKLAQELTSWLESRKSNSVTLFAVYNEEDNFVMNDNWGHYKLFRCVVIRTAEGKVHLFKNLIEKFMH